MILIKNGHVIDPKNNIDQVTDIVIDKDRVLKVGRATEGKLFRQTIDATGMTVAPGLVDIHVHFREPGFEYKEDVISGSRAAAKGGFTTVVCMANTKPLVDNVTTLKQLRKRADEAVINVLNCAAVTIDFNGKDITPMEALVKEGAVGFTDDGVPIMNTGVLRQAMLKAKQLNVPISLHEEDPALIGLAGINDGEVSNKLGFVGAPAVAEDAMVARDCMLAVETGAKVNIQHISSATSVEIVRLAKKLGGNVVAEVSPHHFSATEKLVLEKGTLAKVNPPIRTERDRQALIAGLVDDTIEIIATDHAPHSVEEKNRPMEQAPSGMIGLETALALGVTNLVKTGILTLNQLIEKMTVNPARFYNLEAGGIDEGGKADIVIFHEDASWMVDENFHSKSQNSPFIGQNLYGKVMYTIRSGKIVYQSED